VVLAGVRKTPIPLGLLTADKARPVVGVSAFDRAVTLLVGLKEGHPDCKKTYSTYLQSFSSGPGGG